MDSRTTAALFDSVKGIDGGKDGVTAQTIFDNIDRDGNGTISRDEFIKMYDTVKKVLGAEQEKASRSARRNRVMCALLTVAIPVLAILLAGNAALAYTVHQVTKEADIGKGELSSANDVDMSDRSSLMVTSGTHQIVSVAAAEFKVNASFLGTMDDEMLYSLEKCYFVREKYVDALGSFVEIRQQIQFDKVMRYTDDEVEMTSVALSSDKQGIFAFFHFPHGSDDYSMTYKDVVSDDTVHGGSSLESRADLADGILEFEQATQNGRSLVAYDQHGRQLSWIAKTCAVLGVGSVGLGAAAYFGLFTPAAPVAAAVLIADAACAGYGAYAAFSRRRQLALANGEGALELPSPKEAPRRLSAEEVDSTLHSRHVAFSSGAWCTGKYHN